ncbi:MaoC family dehydratase [Pseudoalteromonas maricaloris]|uniref:MaoC family dehydratase n=1 Tax=Pseudoalteromonas maricaloris TaxID=184924 RepID=A0A8I2H384_9GAMM|nr:MaoC family dehydratase [Pseudoalteromonas maricaloris]NLR21475.1 MaoC family dehydratase [Pseudoalteromonas maricaloris]WOX30159.1 MaoC family dehydratase [Pseudoalteromonas maricaloris]
MHTLISTPFDELHLGKKVTLYKKITESDVELFAQVSGDCNPLHLDEVFAQQSVFKTRVAHGMLSGALISAALAMAMPGPGSIYLGQDLAFLGAVKIDEVIRIELTVREKIGINKVRIETNIFNSDNRKVVAGNAQSYVSSDQHSIEVKAFPFSYIGIV